MISQLVEPVVARDRAVANHGARATSSGTPSTGDANVNAGLADERIDERRRATRPRTGAAADQRHGFTEALAAER